MLSVEKQLFLQRMISNNYIPLEDAIKLINNIVTEINKSNDEPPSDNIDLRELKAILKEINSLIKQDELNLSILVCEVTSTSYLALFSIGNNFINALQLNQNPMEHNYWEKLMKEIVTSDEKAIARLDCLNLVTKYEMKIKLQDAEVFLNTYVRRGYLVLREGKYYLGGRTLAEFGKQFRTSYSDYVQICELCSELCCYGKTCLNCNKVMHCYCVDPALQNNNECPLCHVQWGNFDFEEAAASSVDEGDQSSFVSEETQQMDLEESSQSVKSTRSSQRKKKRNV